MTDPRIKYLKESGQLLWGRLALCHVSVLILWPERVFLAPDFEAIPMCLTHNQEDISLFDL